MKKFSIICILFALHICGFSQVGIGTTTPDSKAALDITSTTQGLLLPRMTISQRNAITSPPTGLIIFCTDFGVGEPEYYNGTTWVNMMGSSAAFFAIGINYQGGILAYILQPGDPGYIAGQVHGLIAAASDQSTGIQWYNGGFVQTSANQTALGTGNANTNTIVAVQGAGSYAAKLCHDLVLNTYSDWYLPSKDELNKLIINGTAIGGFTNHYYWSSSETGPTLAWAQNFPAGLLFLDTKDDATTFVRAIRAF